MTLTLTLHVDAQAEPKGFHDGEFADDDRAFAVSLALNAQIPADEEQDEAAAKAALDAFFDALTNGVFYLVQFSQDGTITNQTKADLLFEPGTPKPDLSTWLEETKGQLLKASPEDQIPFYLSPADQRETASIDNIRAFELQKSAARWPAPAAQNAGLLRAVHTKSAIPDPKDGIGFATIVFLPKDADATAITFEGHEDGRVTLTCPWLDGTTIKAQCDILDPNEDLPAGFGADGTINLPDDAQALGALMGRITERGPAEFWATPVLAGMLTQEWSDPPTEQDKDRFAWLAKAAVTCILDPVIIGLFHGLVRTDRDDRDRQPMLLALATATIAAEVEALGHDIDLDDEALLTFFETLPITGAADSFVTQAQEHFGLTSDARWPEAFDSLNDKLSTDDLVATATALSDELNQIVQLIEDENELETFLVKLLNDYLFPGGNLAPGAAICVTGNDLTPEFDLPSAFKAGMASFAGLLKDRLNAADMLRQDLGATYADILLPESQDVDDLKTALQAANPLLRRHLRDGREKLDSLLDLLPKTDDLVTIGEGPTVNEDGTIADQLNTRWTVTNDDIAMRPEDDVNRFRPDLTPQPLMLPYVALSGRALAEASQKTSGIIYLIRPEDANVSYLNLITLKAGGNDTTTLDPGMPVGGGVIRSPTLPYTGEPLSSPNRDIPVVGGESAGLYDPADLRPFKIDDATYDDAEGYSRVPALAYGTKYQVRAYWVPPSGVLPKVLQSDTSPFVPKTDQADLKDLFPDLATPPAISYRRRTAIAEMALDHARPEDNTDAQTLPTLGQIPQGVHPLALEEPRFLLPGDGRWRSLYRRPDGTGMLIPATSVTLDRIAIPAGSVLNVEIRTGTEAAATLTFGTGDIENDSLKITLPDDLGKATYWLRLQSTKDPISFADPAAGSAVEPAAPPPAPVLLLAPKQVGWSIKPEAKLWLQLPRVSFADFDRWARKTDLMTQATGDEAQGQTLANRIRRTRSVLIATKSNRRDEIDRLPDPAVIGVLIGGAVTHRTTETEAAPISSKWIPTKPYNFTELVLNPLPEDGDKLLEKAEENLDKIAEASRLAIGINFKGDGVDHTLTCQPGMVTRLWASPGILMANIDDALTEPLNRLKVGEYTDGMTKIALFDGPKLSVEVARGIETEDEPVLDDALVPRIPKTARSYTLEVDLSEKGPRGALFSVAAPSTQRWRPTGLPIPVTLNPSLANPAARQSVVQILPKDHKKILEKFETEIYRTRSDADADLRSVRLQGAGLTTEVHRIDWPERSATYLRHNLRLISRYAAVMTAGDDSIPTKDTDWACRMAILADPLRADITRPQIRAYQPLLSRSADRDLTTSPAPPILCTLSEPPYAQLGLAERIDAEIQTRPVYTFEDRAPKEDGSLPEDPILAIERLRKEVGGDPLLTPYRIGADRSRSVTLQTLGVIGLHFDDPETAAPAFVNSMVRIDLNIPSQADDTSPEARATDLEETFVEVSLTRRADPNWSVGIPLQTDRAETAAVAIGDQHDYWLLPPPAPRRDTPPQTVFKLRSSKSISTIYAEGGAGGITILGQSLFPVSEPADYAKNPFSLWSRHWNAVLLSSQGDRRYRLSVFHTDRLEPAASITFQADDPLELETNTIIQPTRVSEPTSARWIKTARDMSTMARGSDGLAVAVADLSAHVITGTTVGFRHALEPTKILVVQPPSALHETTRYLHRRLIQILLWPTPQTGHRRLVGRPDDPDGPDSGVVALCGGDGAAEHRIVTGATALQLAEIEIPAQPIRTVGPDSAAAPYSDAHFDLKAIGAVAPDTCRFFLRASASPIPTATLMVRITPSDAKGEALNPITLDLSPTLADTAETLRWFELILRHDGAPDLIVLTKDGNRERITLEELGTLTLPAGAHSLTLRVETGQEELTWMDVSFLHTRKSKEDIGPDGFDFDWIFGLPHDIDLTLTDSVAAPRLAKVHEAQAAPRGLSDTIPIRPD